MTRPEALDTLSASMGMTAVEKTLALKSGKASVKPGDVVYPDPDFIMIHDGVVLGAKRELDALGIDRLAAPDKVVMVTDHDVIYGSARAAERGTFNRAAARQWGVTNFFDVGRGGIEHILLPEEALVLPGDVPPSIKAQWVVDTGFVWVEQLATSATKSVFEIIQTDNGVISLPLSFTPIFVYPNQS